MMSSSYHMEKHIEASCTNNVHSGETFLFAAATFKDL